MLKDRLKFIILYELKKGTVLANFFGWIDFDLLRETLLEMKKDNEISGEVIVNDNVVLKDIEITEQGHEELLEMLKKPEYEKGYHLCCEDNKLKDWIYGEC
ncbi:hypothetical protein ERX37_08095 [Macrococcus hajekii]|uniref:Uncharacterized protein n=1 Tax=Macrococcus hajekii TaxID=198482 RepID=A0A4R6BII3_9STAP|nr:hypothetical protein [Macrococcus hajekii]TDM01452.1 hypothetical protein ERX37_08095 [Macrococcus hajekii]GGB00112.1 hypothetical protein GCM10007190_05180 [Macrococcus hajekii]